MQIFPIFFMIINSHSLYENIDEGYLCHSYADLSNPLLFISLWLTFFEKFENNSNTFSYYRCKDKLLGKITKNIFDNNGILESHDNWNIYLPCGYNNVEQELKNIYDGQFNPSLQLYFNLVNEYE